MLVPLMVLWSLGLGHEENTFTPGPGISTLPPDEKLAIRKALSIAPTDTMVGEFAGEPAGAIIAGRLLAFPDAAMIRHPAASALEPA